MNSSQKVSVIIPVYNAENYISVALDSISKQTFKNYEIIIVDDGSKDNTKSIIDNYCSENISYIHQNNKGPSAARNCGIQTAKGDYIAFLDADDVWLPSKLAIQTELLNAHRSVGLVTSGFQIIDSEGTKTATELGTNIAQCDDIVEMLIIRNIMRGGPSGVLIRAECLKEVGLFDETLRGAEDRDLWLRVAQKFEIMIIENPLFQYRIHSGNSHKKIDLMKNNQMRFLKKYIGCINGLTLRKAYSQLYFDAAQEYKDACQMFPALWNILLSILYYPFKIYHSGSKLKFIMNLMVPYKLKSMLRGE